MPTAITLKVYRGQELLRTEQFARDIVKIGRLSSAHLCLDDERVSRIHSVIEISPDGAMSIIDMGSAEGTYVNGKRVNKAPLRIGDEVALGGLRVVLEAVSTTPGAAAPAPAPVARAEPAVDETTGAEPLPAAARAPVPEVPPPGPAAVAVAAAPDLDEVSVTVAAPVRARPARAPEAAPARAALRLAAVAEAQAPARPAAAAPSRKEPKAAAKPVVRRWPAPEPEEGGKPGDLGVELRMLWGESMLDAGTFVRPSRPVLVGDTPRCHFLLHGPDLPVNQFPILRYQEKEYFFGFARGMTGEVQENGKGTPLSQLVKERKATPDGAIDGAFYLPVPPKGAVRVEFGSGIAMEARFKRAPKPAVVPWWERMNYQFLNLFLILFFIDAAFVVAAGNYPYETDVVADDLFKNPSRMAKFVIKPPEAQPKVNPYLERLQKELGREAPGEMAERHKGTEGQMGKKDAPKTTGRSAPRAIDPSAKDIVKNTGLVGLLGRGRGGGLSTVFGQGGLGGDIKGAIGNMFGPVVGDSYGLGGLGLKGTGSGGGGQGETIGIGGVGTKGRGGGLGSYGTGVGGLGKKTDRDLSITSTPAIVVGYDRELVRKVVQDHAAQIRYCYEQGLALNPKLEGKVAIQWTITSEGRVSNVRIDSATTLGDQRVQECMMSRVASWEFPKPKGGGIAVVTYPWILRASGSSG